MPGHATVLTLPPTLHLPHLRARKICTGCKSLAGGNWVIHQLFNEDSFLTFRGKENFVKKQKKGFTLVELLIVIAVIAVLMSILLPALQRAREQAKRSVCFGNLKGMQFAWILYANDNDDMIVNGDGGHNHGNPFQRAWVGKCWHDNYGSGAQLPVPDQINAIKNGGLWDYCKELDLYSCPTGYPGEMLTYTVIDSMNAYPQPGNPRGRGPTDVIDRLINKKRAKIRSAQLRIVFLDEGWVTPDSYAVHQPRAEWWDDPLVRHGDGMPVSFVDGHTEYWKWKGMETVKYGRQRDRVHQGPALVPSTPEGKEDLYRVQKSCWWELGYTPTF